VWTSNRLLSQILLLRLQKSFSLLLEFLYTTPYPDLSNQLALKQINLLLFSFVPNKRNHMPLSPVVLRNQISLSRYVHFYISNSRYLSLMNRICSLFQLAKSFLFLPQTNRFMGFGWLILLLFKLKIILKNSPFLNYLILVLGYSSFQGVIFWEYFGLSRPSVYPKKMKNA
jgi:hypothetical protein